MNISELDIKKLSYDEKFFLVMHGIEDLAKTRQSETQNTDLIIVLGASPFPIRARIYKMIELLDNGVSKHVLFSGGRGWKTLLETPGKGLTMLMAIRDTINADLLGDNPTKEQMKIHKRFNNEMANAGIYNHISTFDEEKIRKKFNMTETQFMWLIYLSIMMGRDSANGAHIHSGVKFFREPFSTTTVENMKYTKALIESALKQRHHGLPPELPEADKLLIVTASYHCRRAFLTFKKAFPNAQIVVCPSTEDLERNGIGLDQESYSKSDYYSRQIQNECDAMINYTKNGSIANMSLEELLLRDGMSPEERAEVRKMISQIERQQKILEI